MMLITPSFVIIWVIASLITIHADPREYLLNCGSEEDVQTETLKYVSDKQYINTGNTSSVKTPNVVPLLSSLRYFPEQSARRFCYSFPAVKGSKHLIRTTYFYGGFDGGKTPPVFEQFVDGALWSLVNTTDDYIAGRSSYYELLAAARGETFSVCFGRTGLHHSTPFISALEVMLMDPIVYKPVNFGRFRLNTVARNTFGDKSQGLVGFPDDNYNRVWQPYNVSEPVVYCQSNVTPSSFWNIPPAKVFGSGITTSRGKTLELNWPAGGLPTGKYYMALYFQDNRSPSPYSWRVFNVTLNGDPFYSNLNVSARGVAVYADQWPLSGPTRIQLTPLEGAPVGPVINAAEMLQILHAGSKTILRDVMALEDMKKNISNLPSDWVGDPCLPKRYTWTGIACSHNQLLGTRVTTLNMTGMGLTGTLPSSITNLTDLTTFLLGNNKLEGMIPDLGLMQSLQSLNLENNQLEGAIPESLGTLPNITDINLQNNKLNPGLPQTLQDRQGINIKI